MEGNMKQIRGYIPAGGRGSRMNPLLLCKEMLPVAIQNNEGTEVVLLIEHAIQSLIDGGVEEILFTVNQDKESVIKCINNICIDKRKKSAFIYQDLHNSEYGLPYVIADAAPFLRGNTIFMKFPDTIINPRDCFKKLYEFHKEKNSDLTLGVFSTQSPERLGPVSIRHDGKVIQIQDKPSKALENNTWNIIIWEDIFLDLTVELVAAVRKNNCVEKELLLINIFNKALENELRVFAYLFEEGVCHDISCIEDMKNMWKQADMNKKG